jgi:hypothetical protein
MIREKTAKDARTPNNSIPNSESARYKPPNQIVARAKKIIRELLPETVTLEGSENRSIITGIITFKETLRREVESRINIAWNIGSDDTTNEWSSPSIQVIVSKAPVIKMNV